MTSDLLTQLARNRVEKLFDAISPFVALAIDQNDSQRCAHFPLITGNRKIGVIVSRLS